jgi:hypothetical protein
MGLRRNGAYSMMKVFTVAYGESFVQMARILAASVRENWPGAIAEIITLSRPARIPGHTRATSNWVQKWLAWKEIVDHQQEADFVLMDADMLVLRPLDAAFDAAPFDVCATEQPTNCPISTGVVFVRPGEAARRFFSAVWDEVQRLLIHKGDLIRENRTHGGIDQSAYYAVHHRGGDWKTALLPSDIYNLTKFEHYDPGSTRAVHYWGRLKDLVNTKRSWRKSDPAIYRILADKWLEYKRKVA